jgi:hypothetical protein
MKLFNLFQKRSTMKRLGAMPSPPDERDYLYAAARPPIAETMPTEYIIPHRIDRTYDQGQTPMCVAFSYKRIKESQELKELKKDIPMSAGFIYLNRDPLDLMSIFNAGGMIMREACDHLLVSGVATEKSFTWMGDWSKLTEEQKYSLIPAPAKEEAKLYKIRSYVKCLTDIDIQTALMTEQCGVAINVPVTSKFVGGINQMITMEWAKNNLWGYHAIVIEGWKMIDGKPYWIVANSWGSLWGDNGRCYLPFGYPIVEAWTMVDDLSVTQYWRIQCGAFRIKENAENVQRKLVTWGYPTYIVFKDGYYKVQVGAFVNKEYADNQKAKLDTDERYQALKVGTYLVFY